MKQAFLICAHGNFPILKRLISRLDCENHDIFLHLDRKLGEVDFQQFVSAVKKSKLVCLNDRISVIWGHRSQIEVSLILLEEASKVDKYDYYHFISGVDYPIKSNEYIDRFMEANKGKEFVGFDTKEYTLENKLGLYHFIPGNLRKKTILDVLNRVLLKIQRVLGIHREHNLSYYRKGCNWWTITDELTRALLEEKQNILKRYRFSFCADEIFLQTFVEHSRFKDRVFNYRDEYRSCLRKIDWKRGNPYVWSEKDFDELMKADALFARKMAENSELLITKIDEFIK